MSALGQPPAEGTQPTSTPAPIAPESAPAPAADPVLDRVGEIASGLSGLSERFDSFLQAQQPAPEQEPEVDWWARAFGDEEQPPPAPAAEPVVPQLDRAAFERAVDAQVEARMGPLSQGLQTLQQNAALQQLYQQLPHLADKADATPEEQAAIQAGRTELVGMVQRAVQHYPQQTQAVLSGDPNFIANVFRAAEAQKLASGQRVAEGGAPTLESANGAHPGGTGQQETQSIVEQAHEARRVIPKALL